MESSRARRLSAVAMLIGALLVMLAVPAPVPVADRGEASLASNRLGASSATAPRASRLAGSAKQSPGAPPTPDAAPAPSWPVPSRQQDFDQALSAALAIGDESRRSEALAELARRWGAADASGALSGSARIAHFTERRDFRGEVLRVLATTDPERALALLDLTDAFSERRTIVVAAFHALAGRDGAVAMNRARALPELGLREAAMTATFDAWAQADPRAAGAALLALDDPPLAIRLGRTLVDGYAVAAPREALAWAERLEGRKGALWSAAVNRIAVSDPEQAMVLLTELPPSPWQTQVLSAVIVTIARTQPALAARFVDALPAGGMRHGAMVEIAGLWAQQDPGSALEWVLKQSQVSEYLLAIAGRPLIQAELDHAMSLVDTLTGDTRSQWIGLIVQEFAATAPLEAARWIRRYAQEPGYDDWLGSIVFQVARYDAKSALSLLEHIRAADAYRSAAGSIAMQWASYDPQAAAHWVADQPDGWLEPWVMHSVTGNWHGRDPDAALDWVLELENDAARDAGLQAIAGSGYHDAVAVSELIGLMSSQEAQVEATISQLYRLAEGGSEVAARQAFIDGLNLSPGAWDEVDDFLVNYFADD